MDRVWNDKVRSGMRENIIQKENRKVLKQFGFFEPMKEKRSMKECPIGVWRVEGKVAGLA